jgi:hypothetical protein
MAPPKTGQDRFAWLSRFLSAAIKFKREMACEKSVSGAHSGGPRQLRFRRQCATMTAPQVQLALLWEAALGLPASC